MRDERGNTLSLYILHVDLLYMNTLHMGYGYINKRIEEMS